MRSSARGSAPTSAPAADAVRGRTSPTLPRIAHRAATNMPAKHHGADKHRESPEHVHRLRTAVASTRAAIAVAGAQRALSAHGEELRGHAPGGRPRDHHAPFNVDRRRVRRARDVLLRGGVQRRPHLLLGELSMFTAEERAAITAEQQSDDLLHCAPTASPRRRRTVARRRRALAWYIHSATHTRADYVAKVDDDSMVNLPRLVAELRAVTATAPRPGTRTSACTSTACGTGSARRRCPTRRAASTRTTARPRDAACSAR